MHWGLDLAPDMGHDMLLRYMANSRILSEGWHPISGWYVWYEATIWDKRKWRILYAHMAHRSPHRAWDFVDVGQWAGTIGSTGNSTGNHVHIEIIPDWGLSVHRNMRIDPKFAMEQMELIDKIGGWK